MKEILLQEFKHINFSLNNEKIWKTTLKNKSNMNKYFINDFENALCYYKEIVKNILNNPNVNYNENHLNKLLDKINYYMIRGQNIIDDRTLQKSIPTIFINGVTRIEENIFKYLYKLNKNNSINYVCLSNCFLTKFYFPKLENLHGLIVENINIKNIHNIPYDKIMLKILQKTYANFPHYHTFIKDLEAKMDKKRKYLGLILDADKELLEELINRTYTTSSLNSEDDIHEYDKKDKYRIDQEDNYMGNKEFKYKKFKDKTMHTKKCCLVHYRTCLKKKNCPVYNIKQNQCSAKYKTPKKQKFKLCTIL